MERHVDLTLLSVTTEVSDWLMYRVCHFKKYYCSVIDPFNKSNIYSFPLLTSLKLWFFNRISKAEYDVNSEKLYILDLLKGSVSVLGIQHENGIL